MSAGAHSARTQRVALAVAFAATASLFVGLRLTRQPERHAPAHAVTATAPVAPRCQFSRGETAAFTLESTVRDVRGGNEDHLRAALSVQVVAQLSAQRWRLRASFGDVSHSQQLTLPQERIEGPLTAPFFIDMDAACRFVGFGFARDWDVRRRQFVRSMLMTQEFVLPATLERGRWSVSQADGLGRFEASYELASSSQGSTMRIKRRKAAYDGKTRAEALGLSIAVVGAEATASFDLDNPQWLTSTAGIERIQIRVQGQLQADLLQRFRLVRDDTRFAAMPATAPSDADFRDAFALAIESAPRIDASAAPRSYEEALRGFLASFSGHANSDSSYAAARQLSAWLTVHPEGAHRLIASLRAGAIDESARPALFLGLELSGTETARAALASVLADLQFRAVDRARAASALSDLGKATRDTAELLLSRVHDDRDDRVINVSLLGVGSMSRRSGDNQELKAYIRASLDGELAGAADENKARLVLDAMGNSGDPAFANTLAEKLGAESASTRQHAAEALGRLDPAVAGPQILDRLREETDAAVRATLVGAYHGPATTDAIALMSDKLAASPSLSERSAIIAWLGESSQTHPEARGFLVAQFHRETSARLMQQIGTFVPAAALR